MERAINADKFKEQIAAMTIRDDLSVDKANAMIELLDMQSTVINGIIKQEQYTYRGMTYIQPTEHHYEEPGEKPYIKYGCPVCEALGNIHTVTHGEKNCPLCGVNLSWEYPEQKNT